MHLQANRAVMLRHLQGRINAGWKRSEKKNKHSPRQTDPYAHAHSTCPCFRGTRTLRASVKQSRAQEEPTHKSAPKRTRHTPPTLARPTPVNPVRKPNSAQTFQALHGPRRTLEKSTVHPPPPLKRPPKPNESKTAAPQSIAPFSLPPSTSPYIHISAAVDSLSIFPPPV